MKVFITGVTGYVGHELALFIARKGIEVNTLVRDSESSKTPKHGKIRTFIGDLCDRDSIDGAMKGCDYVFHVAAYTDLRCGKIDPFYKTNVDGTRNVLEAAVTAKVKKVIYTSTLSVFGPALYKVPITETQPRLESFKNDYELTKKMAEELVLEFSGTGLSACILNISRIYGPGLETFSNGINGLIKKFRKNRFFLTPSKLETQANYVFIEDVLDAHFRAIENAQNGERYIIGGENANYFRLFGLIKNIAKSNIKVIKVNYKVFTSLVEIYTRIGRFLNLRLRITSVVLESLFTHRSASSVKAQSQLGYQITPLKIGLEQTITQL